MNGPWRWAERSIDLGGHLPGRRRTIVELRCTVPVVEWAHVDDVLTPQQPRECGSEVYVTWSLTMPVVPGEPPVPRSELDAVAVSSSWEATCENGHTIAASANQYSAQDDAEPFDPVVVFGPVPPFS